MTKKEFEEKLKIVVQNALYQEKKNAPSAKVKPKIVSDSDEEPKEEFLSDKYGEAKDKVKKGSMGQVLSEEQKIENNKVYYMKILHKLREQLFINLNKPDLSKERVFYESGFFLLEFMKNFRDNQTDFLWKFSKNFYEVDELTELKKDMLELDNEKYEHIEQKKDCEDVEDERIEEVQSILTDPEKNNEEQEFLSFLKAGVPHSMRTKFFKGYYNLVVKNNLVNQNKRSIKGLGDCMGSIEKILVELVLRGMNLHEYFIYEKMTREVTAYYIKNYKKLNNSPFESYFGFYPFPGIECFIIAASSISINFDDCKIFFKILHNQIFKPLYNFDCENKENLFALCHFFEKQFLEDMNELYTHLRLLSVFPIDYAAQWFTKLFIGHITFQEVLLLIDRILGFESLVILPLLALGIFKKFYNKLMDCSSQEEIEEILYLPGLKSLKIMNLYLFDDNDVQYDEEEDDDDVEEI